MHDLGKATNRSLAISTSILDDAITLVGVGLSAARYARRSLMAKLEIRTTALPCSVWMLVHSAQTEAEESCSFE